MTWQKDDEGNALPMTASMHCPECGCITRGAYKPDPKLLQSGRWIATNPGSKIKGYHVNALYSPWVNLHDLVEEFVSVNHNRDKHGLMEFVNLKLGEAWEEINLTPTTGSNCSTGAKAIRQTAPPGSVLLLTAGIDVQHDRLECTVYGWASGGSVGA